MKIFTKLPVLVMMAALTSTQRIDLDVSVLASYLGELMNDTLGVSKVQTKVNQLQFEPRYVDGQKFVEDLSKKISDLISVRMDAIRKLQRAVQSSLGVASAGKWPVCCLYDMKDLEQNKHYKTKVDPSNLCEIISRSAPEFYQSLPAKVLDAMKQNRANISTIKWQYVGSEEGILFLYPSTKLSTCGSVEPRLRPWYIETARPDPKHVLILLDTSRSMRQPLHSRRKIDVAVEAVESLLETLTPYDRVGVVTFNKVAERPGGCFTHDLALATPSNVKFLKENFLRLLKAEGESVYRAGFTNGFQLLLESFKQRPQVNQGYVVLFLTDGEPKEAYGNIVKNVYDVIKDGNIKINNSAIIYTYGLGRENVNLKILSMIASQNFSHENTSLLPQPQPGMAFHIQELELLRSKITAFHKVYRRTANIEPTFSVPYIDTGGLGLIFTVALPVIRPQTNELYGVVAIDIAHQEIFADAVYFDSNGDSYIFVIDGNGRVITHPLMPSPANNTDQPKFININQLERNNGTDDIITSMKSGGSGTKSLVVRKIVPVGNSVQTYQTRMTYYWRPIDGANFSVCFVYKTNMSEVTLRPQEVVNYINHRSRFRYHRLDLENEVKTCQYFYQVSTMEGSSVLFAPRSFADPLRYESTAESQSNVTDYKNLFNSLFAATSADEVTKILTNHKATADLFASYDVISDVMWSSFVDEIWVNRSDSHVARRFIGTSNGVDRLFPGVPLSLEFDVTKRLWYELALASPTLAIFSTPYIDGGGAGNVISISQALLSPSSTKLPDRKDRKVIGVMGVDFSLNYLYARLQALYPNCRMRSGTSAEEYGWYCILVDHRGNIILHEDYLGTQSLSVKHILSDQKLMSILKEKTFVKQLKCLDLDASTYRIWYKIHMDARLRESNFQNPDRCSQYFMEPVPNTNIFFVARPNIAWCLSPDCPSYNPKHFCSNKSLSSSWECPCNQPVKLEDCASKLTVNNSIPSCYPPRPQLGSFNYCMPASLPQCISPDCDAAMNKSNCSSLVGCSWCYQLLSGGNLQNPYCSSSENCYLGLEGNPLPGYEYREICKTKSQNLSTVEVILAVVGGCAGVIILMLVFFYFMRKRKQKREKENMAEVCDFEEVPDSPQGETRNGSSPPSSPHHRHHEHRKQSYTPQVILSVVDTDGSEIIRKPVQLINGQMNVGGAPGHGRNQSQDFDLKKPRKRPRLTSNEDSGSSGLKTGSSNANSGGRQLRLSTEEDSGRPATSSGLSENSNRIHMAAGFRKRLPRTPYILRTPVLKRLRKEKKLGKRKRAETASVDDNRSAGIDLGNFAAQSSSDLRDKESGLASKPSSGGSTRRWKSAEDVSRYSDASQQATDTIVNQLGEAEASVKRWERQSREEPCTSAESNQGVVTAPRSGPFQLYL